MKPIVVAIVVVLSILVAGYLFLVPQAPLQEAIETQTYANDAYSVSFMYPLGYVLSEREVESGHYAVTLIKEADVVPVLNGEGPTAVTVEFFETATTISGWLMTPESNFQLSDGTYASTTVNGNEAVHYGWSGLYEGETTALLFEGHVIAVSVSYISPTDPLRDAYQIVRDTLILR